MNSTAQSHGTPGPRTLLRECGAATLLLLLAFCAHAAQPGLDCIRCHGDLELLSRQSASQTQARDLWVDHAGFMASTHADFDCTDCHDGFERFPHDLNAVRSEQCAGCHDVSGEHLETSSHFRPGKTVECRSCHGLHDVSSDVATIDTRCQGCHSNIRRPTSDPHFENLYCSDCHGSHEMRAVMSETDASRFSACEDCHDDVAEAWEQDIHGSAKLGGTGNEPGGVGPASCINCHGSHDILPPDHTGFALRMLNRCATCHPDAAESARNTYHIKATALGSEIVAECADCHGAHGIYPASNEKSWVAPDNILKTCQQCHEYAEAKFAQYQPHPDPRSRDKNPFVFYSFWFMNILLVGVLGVFLLHTAAWWIRIAIDSRRGKEHGHG
jgi:hypothetical protein